VAEFNLSFGMRNSRAQNWLPRRENERVLSKEIDPRTILSMILSTRDNYWGA
jgi:hypothetical protein